MSRTVELMEAAREHNYNVALRGLARAAACSELQESEHGLNTDAAAMLWMQARTIHREFVPHINFNAITDSARRYAQGVYENRINIA